MATRVKSGNSVLYITPTAGTPSEVADIEAAVGSAGKVVVVASDGVKESPSTYDVIVSTAPSADGHSSAFLTTVLQSLKPAGTLILREPLNLRQESVPSLRNESQLRSALTLAGFLDIKTNNTQPDSHVSTFEVVASKPQWEVGAKAALSFGLKRKHEEAKGVWTLSSADTVDEDVPVVVSSKASSVWKISGDEEDELEDEDTLIGADDLRRPSGADLSAKRDDCEVGKSGKKACKNCTCGRADGQMEVEEEKKVKAAEPKSSCGNCYLGDAFRCSSCPYKGLPPFKPGDKVTISLD